MERDHSTKEISLPKVEAPTADTIIDPTDESPGPDGYGDFGAASIKELPLRPITPERFDDLGEIGRGGMGSVRRVFDRSLMREVALKVIHSRHACRPRDQQRFVEEAQIMGQLQHPGIAPVYELGLDASGCHCLCMRLIRGRTLTQVITEIGEKRLEPERLSETLRIYLKICETVAYAHDRGVLHRDLKPDNIMLGDFGEVFVMDWGLAQILTDLEGTPESQDRLQVSRTTSTAITPDGMPVGTPRYMAPEQVHREPGSITIRTDIFGLGAILYSILTGQPPYADEAAVAVLYKAFMARFPPPRKVAGPAVPMELEQVVMKAMARNPGDRYASVSELQREVERFVNGGWCFPTRDYQAGERIVREGELGDEAFIITSGRCRVIKGTSGEERILRELSPGEVFGETAVLSEKPRTATVEAMTDTTVMVVTRQAMSRELGPSRWLNTFITALADRFREVDARLRKLERQDE